MSKTLKQISIETYGDLTNTLFVSFDGEYKFNAFENEANKLNFVDLKIEYNKQSDELITEDLTIKNIDSILTNVDSKSLSIAIYGDLKTTLFVSYDGEYKFNIEGKEENKLNFEDLKVEYNKQSDTLITGDLTIENIDSLLSNIDSISLTNANSKKASIDTYGDLITNNLIVSFEETEFKFNVEENTNKLNFEDLKVEYNKQSDAPITGDLTILNIGNVANSLLTNIDEITLAKAKAKKASIEKLGDLKTKTFEVFVKKNKLMFRWPKPPQQIQIKSDKIYWTAPLAVFNKKLNIQGDTVNEDYTIYNLPSTLNFEGVDQAKAEIQKISIDRYGDLKTTLFVSFDGEYKFNVEENTNKLNFDDLKTEYNKQSDELITENLTIKNIDSILTNVDSKSLSIAIYGDLKTTLFVSYDEEYKFNIEGKEENKLNFEDLKVEYNKQSDTLITGDLTILNIGNVENSLLRNIDKTSLAKAKIKKISIETYGDLTIGPIESDFEKNNYTFQIGNKEKINSRKNLHIEFFKQTGKRYGSFEFKYSEGENMLYFGPNYGFNTDSLLTAIEKHKIILKIILEERKHKAQTYFDLNIEDASNFNKADQTTIDLITSEINKDYYNTLTPGVKKIVDHVKNSVLKNALNNKIQALKTKKTNLESAQTYFDLSNVKNASFFNKADDVTINLIDQEINKINDYDDLADEIKAIVDHDDNLVLKNSLNTRLHELEEKKANLESVKTYFDLTGVQNPSIFNKADQTTIDLITSEINKINDYDSLSEDVKLIVDHDDNSEYKNALNTRLQELEEKKVNLELAQTYFNNQKANTFIKADQTTIDSINQVITKINDYENFSNDLKTIIKHNDNHDFKVILDEELIELNIKKELLQSAQTYFDLTEVQVSSNFNKADQTTIDSITTEINKINDYNNLSEDVKTIIDHDDNSEYKNALNTRLHELEEKKANLESAQTYFDLTNVQIASNFNKADDQTIDLITSEINKINDYDNLSEEIKIIVEHNDNLEYKNVLNTRLHELEEKKANLELTKAYFDLSIETETTFTEAKAAEIDLITDEINKDNHNTLTPEVKAIVDHDDNSDLKSAFDEKIEALKRKKTDLTEAKAYFDLDILEASTFTEANTETIESIQNEINKKNFDSLPGQIKAIVNHDDNSELKGALNEKIKALETKKTHLIEAKTYFNLDILEASTFTEANTETIESIQNEINKKNFDSLPSQIKAIVNYDDNSDLKNAIDQKIANLKIKKRNLELAKTYFDLDIKEASIFTKAKIAEIDLITTEIDKDNFDSLPVQIKAIVDHDDNSDLKSAFDEKIEALKRKKTELTETKTKLDSIETYGDLTTTLFVSFDEVDEEYKFNIKEKEENKLNFEDLKAEYNKQSDTPIKEDLTIKNINSILKNIDQKTLLKTQTKANENTDQKPKTLIELPNKPPVDSSNLGIVGIISIVLSVFVLISVILVCFWKIFKKKTKNKKNEHQKI